MTSSSTGEFPAAEKKILMRKLDFTSEENRNHLLKTYDLADISVQITMARKEKTMEQNKDLQSVLDIKSDSNKLHYDISSHSNAKLDAKAKTTVTKTETVKTTPKRISLETYRKRKQEAIVTGTLHKNNGTTDGEKLQPPSKFSENSMKDQSVDKTTIIKVQTKDISNEDRLKEHLLANAKKQGPLLKFIRKSEKHTKERYKKTTQTVNNTKEQIIDNTRGTNPSNSHKSNEEKLKEHLLANVQKHGPLPEFVKKSEKNTKEPTLSKTKGTNLNSRKSNDEKLKEHLLANKLKEHVLANVKKHGPLPKFVKKSEKNFKDDSLEKIKSTDLPKACISNEEKVKEYLLANAKKHGPLPKFVKKSERNLKEDSLDKTKGTTPPKACKSNEEKVKEHLLANVKKRGSLPKVIKKSEKNTKEQTLDKTRGTNLPKKRKSNEEKLKEQLLANKLKDHLLANAKKHGPLPKFIKKSDKNFKDDSLDKTKGTDLPKASKSNENKVKEHLLANSMKHGPLPKFIKKNEKKFKEDSLDKTKGTDRPKTCKSNEEKLNRYLPVETAKDIIFPKKHDATKIIAEIFAEKSKIDPPQRICENMEQEKKEQSIETAKAIVIPKKHDATKIISEWFADKSKVNSNHKVTENIDKEKKEQANETAKTIVIPKEHHDATKIISQWFAEKNKIDSLQNVRKNSNQEKNDTLIETENAIVFSKRHDATKTIAQWFAEKDSSTIIQQTSSNATIANQPCLRFHPKCAKVNENITILSDKTSPIETKNQVLNKTICLASSLQISHKEIVRKSKKRSLDDTDMNEPLPKYLRKYEHLLDSVEKLDTSVMKDQRYSIDTALDIIDNLPSCNNNKKRSLDSVNDIDASVAKKMKCDVTITTDVYIQKQRSGSSIQQVDERKTFDESNEPFLQPKIASFNSPVNKNCSSNFKNLVKTSYNINEKQRYHQTYCLEDDRLCKPQNLVSWLKIDVISKSFDWLYENELSFVESGGWWAPSSCKTPHQTAIIIPFRDREEHLQIFLRQVHPVMKRNNIHYRIFVIEQKDESSFNRGKLMNVGFREAQKFFQYSCYVFHDVDLIQEDDRLKYTCQHSPMHMSVAVDKFNYVLPYKEIFGGVEMFTRHDFETINGFPNMFWSWGGEDDNLQHRCKVHKLEIYRPSIKIARYRMLTHSDNKKRSKTTTDQRWNFMLQSKRFIFDDGLKNLRYHVIKTEIKQLYTLIQVDLKRENDKVFFK